ncbi:MAG TPA: hypothetical protein VLU41_10180 [Ideonella sp.]|nr:hypothetical protein [Ideonella sp.]
MAFDEDYLATTGPIVEYRKAYITVDRLGAPRGAGGMCVTLRDLARVGPWIIGHADACFVSQLRRFLA